MRYFIFLFLIFTSCCPTKKIVSEDVSKVSISDSLQKTNIKKSDLIINTELISHREVISEQLISAYCNEKGKIVINDTKISSGNNKASVKQIDSGFMLRLELGAYEEKNKELTLLVDNLEKELIKKEKELTSAKLKTKTISKTPSWVWYLIIVLLISLYLNFNNKPISIIRKFLRF